LQFYDNIVRTHAIKEHCATPEFSYCR